MQKVKPKKHLGQHFLKDMTIARQTANLMSGHGGYKYLLEIGPGTGALTQFLLDKPYKLQAMEVDGESVAYLHNKWPDLTVHEADFLQTDLLSLIETPFAVVGNFPYNISTQIFFRVLELRQHIPEVAGMLQKEVAERMAAPPGNKTYGILSVLLQAYYDIEYCFTVNPDVFVPPPKVFSAVIRLKRNNVTALDCDEKLFFRVVKQGFGNRRKMLSNALKSLGLPLDHLPERFLKERAEQLSVADFTELTQLIDPK